MKIKKTGEKAESALVSVLDEIAFYKELQPAIAAALKYGGSADKLLKRSQVLAAVKLLELLKSDKEDVQLRAAGQLLDRALGRSVERKVNINADIDDLNPKEIDAKIKRLLKKYDSGQVIDAIIEIPSKLQGPDSDKS